MVENHVVLVAMPKSGTMFLRRALAMTAGLEFVRMCNPDPLTAQLNARRMWDFLETPRAQAGQHMPASDFNINFARRIRRRARDRDRPGPGGRTRFVVAPDVPVPE
jgi:hypothetical protein